MLELTKTKTKHQLGDFFFHFSFASFTSDRSPFLSFILSVSLARLLFARYQLRSTTGRRRRGAKEEGAYIYCVYACVSSPPMPSTVSFSRCNLHLTPPYTRSLSRSPLPLCANGNKVARFKLYASFGAQVAALSQIMANKLFDEIARDSRTTIVSRRSLAVRCTAPRAVSDRAEGCFCHTALDFFLTLLSLPPFLLFSIFLAMYLSALYYCELFELCELGGSVISY